MIFTILISFLARQLIMETFVCEVYAPVSMDIEKFIQYYSSLVNGFHTLKYRIHTLVASRKFAKDVISSLLKDGLNFTSKRRSIFPENLVEYLVVYFCDFLIQQ